MRWGHREGGRGALLTCFSSESTAAGAGLEAPMAAGGSAPPNMPEAAAAPEPKTDDTGGKIDDVPAAPAGENVKPPLSPPDAASPPSALSSAPLLPSFALSAAESPSPGGDDFAAKDAKPEAVPLAAAAKAKGFLVAALAKEPPKRGAGEAAAAGLSLAEGGGYGMIWYGKRGLSRGSLGLQG